VHLIEPACDWEVLFSLTKEDFQLVCTNLLARGRQHRDGDFAAIDPDEDSGSESGSLTSHRIFDPVI
jgi:hypothetical protein